MALITLTRKMQRRNKIGEYDSRYYGHQPTCYRDRRRIWCNRHATRHDYVTTTRQQRRHAANAKFLQHVIKFYKTAVIVNRTNSKLYEPFVALFHLHDTSMS